LQAPDAQTLKDKRDRAMLSTLLYHGLRREELCTLKIRDITQRRGVAHLRVHGKGGKTRYLPLHPGTAERITEYVEVLGHGGHPSAPLFRPVRNNVHQRTGEPMTTDGVYKVVQSYARKIGLGDIDRLGVHALRTMAATNALDHQADIAKVQEWLGQPTSRPRDYMIAGSTGRRTPRPLRWRISRERVMDKARRVRQARCPPMSRRPKPL
jgi:integrase